MFGMFDNCSSLKELNLSNFNTNNITSMNEMFSGCSEKLMNKVIIQAKSEKFKDLLYEMKNLNNSFNKYIYIKNIKI